VLICQQRFLFDAFKRFLCFHKKRVLTAFILGVKLFYIYAF